MTESDPLYTRVLPGTGDPVAGSVRWSPAKSLWWIAMLLGWIVGGAVFFSWDAVAVFVLLTGAILCLGHSLGMHRRLIHEAYGCPSWIERLFVYLGTLVGLGGPFTMMRTHDLRDWAQRQPACHPYLAHQYPLLADFRWQLHGELLLQRPPAYRYPGKLSESRFYRFLESTEKLQQLPVGLLLFALGGWGWVAWGVCGRVTVSVFGHWIVGHYAHNRGRRDWHVDGAAVQGHNLRWLGLVTFGECWHNNHHAFPGSARLGLYPGQFDPGWRVLKLMERAGLAWALRQPEDLPPRAELRLVRELEVEQQRALLARVEVVVR